MSSKALVEISVPAAGEKYDVFIPLDIKMGEVLQMVSGIMADLTQGKFRANEDTVLCNGFNGAVYDVNIEGAEQGIKNGSHLMLI